jgi:adenosylcobinamide kinase / adenosylcobinamide-phosphate guanylyltransferase
VSYAVLGANSGVQMIVLVTGGARSGKSRLAEARCLAFGVQTPAPQGQIATYIATAEPFDDEMRARIALHRARRGVEWGDHPAPLDLASALQATDNGPARLVDCLTMWLNNLIYHQRDVARARAELQDALRAATAPVVLVTNEIGMGIVPENALARAFRDAQGLLNQDIAAIADEVILAVAGLPLRIK